MHGIEPDDWLWCQKCERFFQAKDLRVNEQGDADRCPFKDCGGDGVGSDIYRWDSWAKANPEDCEHWPKTTRKLSKGMKCHCPDSAIETPDL